MNKKAELTLLKFVVGFLVLSGLLIAGFLFVGESLNANNVTLTNEYNKTFELAKSTVSGIDSNDTVQQAQIITSSNGNVTGASNDPFRQSYDTGNQYGKDNLRFLGGMRALMTSLLNELGIPVWVIVILGIIISTTMTFLIISFIRSGR